MKLDMHCEMILDEYREKRSVFEKLRSIVMECLQKCLAENNIVVSGLNSRIKTEQSLTGKLELKGYKYRTLDDITDIIGVRVITFFSDEVDIISALAEKMFEIDWDNTVDKRKMLEIDRFGYMSLHYICRLPKTICNDPDMPELNEIRFELQMRSTLQHVWANMYHDMGYKTDVEIPREYKRNMSRLAGMLELADEQFSLIRKDITECSRSLPTATSMRCLSTATLSDPSSPSILLSDCWTKWLPSIRPKSMKIALCHTTMCCGC